MKFHKSRKEEVESTIITNDYNRADDYMLKILVEMNRPDWMINKNIKDLLRKQQNGESYLDYILQSFKKNPRSVNLSDIIINFRINNLVDLDSIADVYLTFAKYDLVGYLPRLTKSMLLKIIENTTLLDLLIKKDHILTLNRVLSDNDLYDKDVLITLGLNNINLRRKLDIELLPDNLTDACCEWYNGKYDNITTDPEFENKLDDLRKQLLKNGSEEELVESVIKSYRVYYLNNREYANMELDNLRGTYLYLKYGKNNEYFNNKREVNVTHNNITILGHEFGHGVFMSLTDVAFSDEFDHICHKVRIDNSVPDKVSRLSNMYYEAAGTLGKRVSNSWNRQKYIKKSDDKEISEFLNKTKDIQKKKLKDRGYDPEIVDFLIDLIYTKEEYSKSFESNKKLEMKSALLRTEYAHILAMADIIDAVFKGNYMDEKIKDSDYKAIRCLAGHGLNYYNSNRANPLDEIMANYSQLIRSFHYKECMNLLTYILGAEFVQSMQNMYYEQALVPKYKTVERSL